MFFFSGTLQLLHSSSRIFKGLQISLRYESTFVPKRVLVLAKVSRYDFEKLREPELSENQIKTKIVERGSDCQAMLESHRKNQAVVSKAVETLKNMNIEYKLTDRSACEKKHINCFLKKKFQSLNLWQKILKIL